MTQATVKAVFLGRLQQVVGAGERDIVLDAPISLSRLRTLISQDDALLRDALADDSIRVALDGVLLPILANPNVSPSQEVAFLPPFSGG